MMVRVRVAHNDELNVTVVAAVDRIVTGQDFWLRYRLLFFDLRVVWCCLGTSHNKNTRGMWSLAPAIGSKIFMEMPEKVTAFIRNSCCDPECRMTSKTKATAIKCFISRESRGCVPVSATAIQASFTSISSLSCWCPAKRWMGANNNTICDWELHYSNAKIFGVSRPCQRDWFLQARRRYFGAKQNGLRLNNKREIRVEDTQTCKFHGVSLF